MKPVIVLAVCGMLCTGCLPRDRVLPDPSIPHRVATETTMEIWVFKGDGQYVRERVRVLPGWWVASPQVVEARD